MKTMFPRAFLEWIITNERFLITIDREFDGRMIRWYFMDYESTDMERYSLDDLYKYWRLEIEPKTKEDEKDN
jgi:hypothetical protein